MRKMTNFADRTIWTGDNLDILRGLNSASVDLIYLDPRSLRTGTTPNQQEGQCNECRSEFPFRVLEVDHIVPQRAGCQDNIENLQLLCAHCNRVKGDRPQEYLVARLKELSIAA